MKKSDFNQEVKSVVASGPGGVIWMVVNPAADTVSYRLEVDGGAFVESRNLDRVLDVYNRWEARSDKD